MFASAMGTTATDPTASATASKADPTASAAAPNDNMYKSPIIFCFFVLGYELICYNVVFLARILPAVHKADYAPVFGVIFNLVWFMTMWTYLVVRCSDPGTITDQWRAFVQNTPGLDVIVSRQEWQPGKVTTNKKSNDIRPERAHFCSTTLRDVLRMDHFCPWTGNTIGLGNHKHFLLLGFYGALSGAVACGTALPELIGITTGFSEQPLSLDAITLVDRVAFFFFYALAMIVMVLLGGLFTSHFPLACRNMTTIEELYTNMPNPYDQQNWFRNLEQVFGRFGYDWILPIKPRNLKSDGFSYRRNGEVLPEGLVEVYLKENQKLTHDIEPALHRLPEDIWHFRYTGQTRAQQQEASENSRSWFAWLSGG